MTNLIDIQVQVHVEAHVVITKIKWTRDTKMIEIITEIQSIVISNLMTVIKTIQSLKKMLRLIGMRMISIVIQEKQMIRIIMRVEIISKKENQKSQVIPITKDTLKIKIIIKTDVLN